MNKLATSHCNESLKRLIPKTLLLLALLPMVQACSPVKFSKDPHVVGKSLEEPEEPVFPTQNHFEIASAAGFVMDEDEQVAGYTVVGGSASLAPEQTEESGSVQPGFLNIIANWF